MPTNSTIRLPAADIALTPASGAQSTLLAALHAECFDAPWSATIFAEMLALPGRYGWIAAIADEPVGFVLVQMLPPEIEIQSLGVASKARRRGAAGMLLRTALDRAWAEGCKVAFLEVAESNHGAQALYGRSGFRVVGRRPDYYRHGDGRREAALIMRRDLSA